MSNIFEENESINSTLLCKCKIELEDLHIELEEVNS